MAGEIIRGVMELVQPVIEEQLTGNKPSTCCAMPGISTLPPSRSSLAATS
jgi:hypothetical protein